MNMPQYPDRVLEEIIVNNAVKNRKLYLCDEVSRESIFKIIYYMDRIKELDDKENIKYEDRKPIEIIIDSYGGCVYSGLGLLSKMLHFQNLGYIVKTHVSTVAMSMGFMILIAGTKGHRTSMSLSRIMCHQPSSYVYGSLQHMQDDIEETKTLWNKLKEIIINRTNITDEKLEEIKKHKYDWFMFGDEAKELGVVDIVL